MDNVCGKLPVDGFKWRIWLFRFDEEFIQRHEKDSDKGYILKDNAEYLQELQNLNSDLSFLPEKTKIKICEMLVSNLYDKKKIGSRHTCSEEENKSLTNTRRSTHSN